MSTSNINVEGRDRDTRLHETIRLTIESQEAMLRKLSELEANNDQHHIVLASNEAKDKLVMVSPASDQNPSVQLHEDDKKDHVKEDVNKLVRSPSLNNRTERQENNKQVSRENILDGYELLFDAAAKGDWLKANEFFKTNPTAMSQVITVQSQTPLHIAVINRQWMFVEEILKVMPPEALELKERYYQNTALHQAVWDGNTKAAEMMYHSY
ncbi:uncharacterized protein LOC113273182 [Papaver somniferum]|uniref:uncharacterized protein LOC113273182 n=1 Tax=Papaver somniferum TaxID=3469 RepID=UPI000E6F5636|nr:uncharacterized protein LOC113273182 [Papaver somniferum]